MPSKDTPRVPQKSKPKLTFEIKPCYKQKTTNHQNFVEKTLDKNNPIIIVDGLAGTAKTYLSVYCALQLLKESKVKEIVYLRTIIESASRNLGSLPGEFDEKFKPFITPLEDKLKEFLNKGTIDGLKKTNTVHALPINYLRGASFNASFLLLDEAQNATKKELVTLMTRLGKYSKLVICGDSKQNDINGKSGFQDIFDTFSDNESRENGIHTFKFDSDDIVRSGILKFILDKLDL